MTLYTAHGQPLSTARVASRQSRDAGSLRGSLSTWFTQRVTNAGQEQRELALSSRRADDLYANDCRLAACACVMPNSLCGNLTCGMRPVPTALVQISLTAERAVQEQMEWAFSLWSAQAHVKGIESFEGLQYCALRSILRNGECFHLPVMLPVTNGRTFSLALQDISPHRVMTPADKCLDPMLRTGVRLSPYGAGRCPTSPRLRRPARRWTTAP